MPCLSVAFALRWAMPAGAAELAVRVNIPSCRMTVVQDGRPLVSFPVRTGSRDMPTPSGRGKIVEKRERVVFRYLEGARTGEVIRRSHIDPTGETIDMPYDRLRGLKVDFDDGSESTVIHSTTEYWTIGFPVSHGCIGMDIDDMLRLFDLLGDEPVDITITYKTVEFDAGNLRFYPDVYGHASSRVSELLACGVPVNDIASAENRIAEIDRRLRFNLAKALAEVRAGRDARPFRNRLVIGMPAKHFLSPFHPQARIVDVTVLQNDSFASALGRGGLSAALVAATAEAVEGIDYRRLQPGDAIALTVEGGEVSQFEYAGRQGIRIMDLRGRGLMWE
jgi:hypothetical protein